MLTGEGGWWGQGSVIIDIWWGGGEVGNAKERVSRI